MNFTFGYGFGMALTAAMGILTILLEVEWWVLAPLLVLGLFFMAKGDYDAKKGVDE